MDATDRKLIEAAGRAAGETYSEARNPLEDDSLAFRLAVKLELQLRLRHSENEISVYGALERIDEAVRSDPYAATRRAIVRAAAALAEPRHD